MTEQSYDHARDIRALLAYILLGVERVSGRFLSKESGEWIEVSDADIAGDKVSHTSRTCLVLIRRGHRCAIDGIKVWGSTELSVSPDTNKRVKL
jgi:hypothetical protein